VVLLSGQVTPLACHHVQYLALYSALACAVPCAFIHSQAHKLPLADPWASRLSSFQALLVLRCLRPDKVLAGIQEYVANVMGTRFIEAPPFDLGKCFADSQPATPLVFVLSPGKCAGWDWVLVFQALVTWQHLQCISLGEGAEKTIQFANFAHVLIPTFKN
jgi:dynein heavy chain